MIKHLFSKIKVNLFLWFVGKAFIKEHLLSFFMQRDCLGTHLFTGLGHICTSPEWCCGVLQNVAYTEAISIEAVLITYFGTK